MSDPSAQSDHGTHGTGRQSMHNYQVSWMSHWKHTSLKPSIETHSDLPLCNQFKDDHSDIKQQVFNYRLEKTADVTKFTQGFGEFSEAGRVDIRDKSLKMGAMKLGEESLDVQPFPVFNTSQNQDSAVAINKNQGISSPNEVEYQLHPRSDDDTATLGRSKGAHPEMECNHHQPKGILWSPKQLVKSHSFREKNILSVSLSFQPDVGSTSKFVPHGFNSEGAEMQSFMHQQEEIHQSGTVAASKEQTTNANFCSHSTFSIHEKETNTEMESRKLETSLARRNDSSPWLHETSTSHSQPSIFLNKQSQKGEDDSDISLPPSRGSYPEVMKSVKGYHQYSSLSVRDVETMRIHATLDSMEELPSGPPNFSQTTHEFFITKKTNVNLSSLGQVFRDTKVSSQLKGKMFSDFLSPSFSFQGQQELNLQPLRSSTDSEGKENAGNVKTSAVCLKNESSAETDAMELDFFQQSHLSGVPLCPPNQKILGAQNSSTSQATTASGTEETAGRIANKNTDLSDMNQEAFAVPEAASQADDRETSPSRTLSLDAEHLLSHAEKPTNSKSTACSDGLLRVEPYSRWVKRLRLGSSELSNHGTKRSKTGEGSSEEKVNGISSKSITSSGPTVGRRHVKPRIALGQSVMLLKNSDSSLTDSVRQSQNVALLHSWIQRWAKNRAASRKKEAGTTVLSESQSSKAALDERQKKQLPSIAAMALMGKAISGFHPCEFRRRGSVMVWNT